MKKLFVAVLIFLTVSVSFASFNENTGVISNERWKSGVPLGGIGCGKLEILTDGGFGYYTGNNNWDRPTGRLKGAFFGVYAQSGDKKSAKILRLPSSDEYSNVDNVKNLDYAGWFPTADISYPKSDLPVDISVTAWSPLIPNNIEESSLPVASFKFKIHNPNDVSAKTTLFMAWPNMVGYGGRVNVKWDDLKGNIQRFYKIDNKGILLFLKNSYTTSGANSIGEYAICASAKDALFSYTGFDASLNTLGFWDAFSKSGTLVPPSLIIRGGQPAGAISSTVTLKPKEWREIDFTLVWHFPNHTTLRIERLPSSQRESSTKDVAFAFDGDPVTRWATGRSRLPGDAFALDLGGVHKISQIVLDSKLSPTDYPSGYRVELSDTGTEWQKVTEEDHVKTTIRQQSGVLTIPIDMKDARYIRITQLAESKSWYWSIHEIKIMDSSGIEIDRKNFSANALLTKYKTKEIRGNLGHYYSRKAMNTLEMALYVDKHKDWLLSSTKKWQDPIKYSNLPMWLKQKLINSAFPAYACSILTIDGRFAVQESPVDMNGALGTMDQRMAAHAFWTQMFPELDEVELRLFAKCQDLVTPIADGRITHFDGNIHEVVGDPNVPYGITDWPDLACSWVMQTVKLYKWTGDRAFLNDMWPHIKRAMVWLKSADTDGDNIPEGGSTYDYETLPRGSFSYTASCYLGALKTAEDAAKILDDVDAASEYSSQFKLTQKSFIDSMWNGKFFVKHLDPKTGIKNENSFVAQLAGDWLSGLTASGRTLPADIIDTAVRETIARHVKPFYPIPPMEVTPEGKLAFVGCYVLQHEPYLGCEAIYQGYTDDGLEVIKRIYDAAWLVNHNPWQQPLSFMAPSGDQGGLVSYMTAPATWHVLNALSGITLDVPAKRLYVSPRTSKSLKELHMPVFLGKLELWIDYVPSENILKVGVDEDYGTPIEFEEIAMDGNSKPILLPKPFIAKRGAILDLSAYIDRLVPVDSIKTVDYSVEYTGFKSQRTGIPSAGWVSDSGHGEDIYAPSVSAGAAYDGNSDSRWSTNSPMRPGDWMVVDMGNIHSISKIVLDSTGSPNDYPRGCAVMISKDGAKWLKATELSSDECRSLTKDGVTEISIQSTETRYVKIIQNGSVNGTFWSIHELYIYE